MTAPKSVLLLHGFTGSPFDMVPLSKALAAHGMAVEVATLAGHGTEVKDLLDVKSSDWLTSGQLALDRLPGGPKVVVALSMGCFVATWLAAKKSNNVAGLVFLAPAFVLRPFGRIGVALSKLGIHRLKPYLHKTSGPDICDKKARRESQAYGSIPLRTLVEFEALREQTIPLLRDVHCPVFVGFGAHDHTVDNEGSTKVLETLSSKRVQHQLYANSAHIVPLDFDRDQVSADIVRFMESLS